MGRQLIFWLGHSLVCALAFLIGYFLKDMFTGYCISITTAIVIELTQLEAWLMKWILTKGILKGIERGLKTWRWGDTVIDLVFDGIGIGVIAFLL